MLIFLRQAIGTDHDWEAAEAFVKAEYWTDVVLQRGGTINRESAGDMAEMYHVALVNGGAIVVYSTPL